MAQESTQADVQKWIQAIASYDREFKKWEERTKNIIKIYRDYDASDDVRGGTNATFNILWSNVQTCLPATFARLPKPDVSRRFRDNDPVGRVASLILERALEFEIEHYPDYRAAMEGCVLDRFLGGRGQSWVRYEPHFKAAEQGMPEDGVQVTEDADESEDTAEAQEVIDYECAPVDYVHWRDFGHVIARKWEEVTAVWRRVYMTRSALVERFGEEIGDQVPLDTRPNQDEKMQQVELHQACIYEIWDKSSNKAIWLSKSMGKILDERDDPLELECFFPCPKPLFATLTNENLIPVPDYKLYQDQAQELNVLADRIDGLIKALRVRGVYDASVPELARLFTEAGDNQMIPVKTWAAFSEKNGLKGAIDIVDLKVIVSTLTECYASVEQVKNEIYEIMGIADIIRGSSDPGETLGAQKLKGQFGSLRLRHMQSKVGQFATEILQIKAQIMCRLFQPETLVQISAAMQLSTQDQQMIQPAIEMLKNEPMRNFRIEVSSDSMVQMDEQQEKVDRMEFLQATGAFLEKALPAAQQEPSIAPLLMEMLKFGVTGYKVGKSIEGAFDEALDKMRVAASQPPGPPPPDPEMVKVQAESQARQQEMQQKAQLDQQSQQNKMQLEQHKQEVQAQQIAHQNDLEAQRAQMQAHNDAILEQQRMAHEAAQEQSRQQFEMIQKSNEENFLRWKAELDAAVKVEVANISSKAKLQDAATDTSTAEISSEVQQ